MEYLRARGALAQAGWSPRRCIPHGRRQMSRNITAGLGGNEN